jgi:hypothetical protein
MLSNWDQKIYVKYVLHIECVQKRTYVTSKQRALNKLGSTITLERQLPTNKIQNKKDGASSYEMNEYKQFVYGV